MSRIIPPNTVIIDPTTGIQTRVEANEALAVNIQDQTSPSVDFFLVNVDDATGITTNSVATAVEDTTLTLVDTTGFVDGSWVGVSPGDGTDWLAEQIGAPAAGVITLDTPCGLVFPIGTPVFAISREMNIAGTLVAPKVFKLGPLPGVFDVDVTRIMGYIQDGSAMDDAMFGGLTALTNGLVVRISRSAGTSFDTIWNVKSNGDIGLICYDSTYTDKAPAGEFGFRFRNTYAGAAKHGVTLRLSTGDALEVLVQDDLTGLTKFRMMAQGHIVTD